MEFNEAKRAAVNFGNLIAKEERDPSQIPNTVMNSESLVDPEEFTKKPEPVDLNMNSLVEKEKHFENKEPVQVFGSFDNLISNEPVIRNSRTFAIQELDSGIDISMLPKPIVDQPDEERLNKQTSNNRRFSNWFTRLIEQKGEDYITSGLLSADEVSRNAERIFDDIINGRIDYTKHGFCIIQPVVINTLINYCTNKLSINNAIQFALSYLYEDYSNRACMGNDPNRMAILNSIDDTLSRNITQSLAIINQDINVYTAIYNKLVYVDNTKNTTVLMTLSNDLIAYRKQVRKRF